MKRSESLGLLLERISCRVIVAGRQTMPAGWSLPERKLTCHDVIFVESGTGTFTVGEQRSRVTGPAWVILPANASHSIDGVGLRLAVVHLEVGVGRQLDGMRLYHPALEISPDIASDALPLFQSAIDAWREGTAVGRVSANRWMELWFIRAFGSRDPVALDERLVSALACLHESAARPVRLDELASKVGLSSAHLRSLFRQQFGASPKQVLQDIRLTRARALLSVGSAPVAEVAYEAGWEDVSAFNRSFRRRFGMSPGEYRRLATAQPIA